MEREARYHEYVGKQQFLSIDTLDDKMRRKIMKQAGKDLTAQMSQVASGELHSIASYRLDLPFSHGI